MNHVIRLKGNQFFPFERQNWAWMSLDEPGWAWMSLDELGWAWMSCFFWEKLSISVIWMQGWARLKKTADLPAHCFREKKQRFFLLHVTLICHNATEFWIRSWEVKKSFCYNLSKLFFFYSALIHGIFQNIAKLFSKPIRKLRKNNVNFALLSTVKLSKVKFLVLTNIALLCTSKTHFCMVVK